MQGLQLVQIQAWPGYVTIKLEQDEDGHFVDWTDQADPKVEQVEDHLRRYAGSAGKFAEIGNTTGDPHTADPNGIYDCGPVPELKHGGCNKYRPGQKCVLVQEGKGGIKPKVGSCEHYEEPFKGDFELDLQRTKMTKEEAGYGERQPNTGLPGVAKWGCATCKKWGRKAKRVDSKGRKVFCSKWGCRVQGKACCKYNDAPGDVAFKGNEPIQADQVSSPKPRTLRVTAVRVP